MSNWATWFGAILIAMGHAFAWFLFGLPFWFVLGSTLCFIAGTLRMGFFVGFIAGMLNTGYGFTVLLFGNPLYVEALIGCIAIGFIVFGAFSRGSEETMPSEVTVNG